MAYKAGTICEKSLQALKEQELLKDTKTYKLEFCEHYVIGKKMKLKFGTWIHCTIRIFDYAHTDVWRPIKTALLGDNHYFMS